MNIFRTALASVLVLAMATTLVAKDKGEKGKRGEAPSITKQFPFLEGLTLTAEQTAKIEDVRKEYAPKMGEIGKKMREILTPEQQKTRQEAEKEAKAAGKNGHEAAVAADEAAKVTGEQKAKLAEIRKEMAPLSMEMREKIVAVLTPEQKAQIKDKLAAPAKGKKNK
jgi:Spy/CpxP family protein refolding chaperone